MKEGELGRVFPDGEAICREGEKGDCMYVIQSGKVRITKSTDSGEVTIATLGNGEIFGEMALFDRLPRSATALASGDARVLCVDRKKFFSVISRDPTLAFKILEAMSQRIRTLDGEIAKLKRSRLDILRSCTDVTETCNLVLEEIRNAVSAEKGSIMLLESTSSALEIAAAFGSESSPKLKLSPGVGIAGDVMKTGKAELVNNVSIDARFVPGKSDIASMLCVPLRFKDNVFGVINMSTSSEKLFTIDDLKLLHSLAVNASMAIQNARSCSFLKDATEEVLKQATMLDMT
jgi:CRP-like cAMP-binding protein